MRFATDAAGQRVEALASGERANCDCCGAEVIAKCGQIVVRHWAHVHSDEFDTFAEPMTAWHRRWQDYLKSEHDAALEVVIRRDGQAHRADAVLPNGLVVELQHSAISVEEIQRREAFYGADRMIWVFDCAEAYLEDRFNLRDRGSFHSFRWKHPRKSVAYAMAPVRLDLGLGTVMRLKKIYTEAPCGGWGVLSYVPQLDASEDSQEGF